MIVIVGASGRLGSIVARQLFAQGKPVRAISRTPEKLEPLRALGAEVMPGDLRDPLACACACQGADQVFVAAHAFNSTGQNVPRTVDGAGNRHVIDAARQAGVAHFVFTSIAGARPDHPVDIFRFKYEAEQYLRASGLRYTILRPTAFMELWATIIGEPIARRGQALIFGRGVNPINFVSVADVARFALLALQDEQARDQLIEVGGPENLSLLQFAESIERVTGHPAKQRHIPLALMRVMRSITRPINPAFSRLVASSIFMDTHDMTFDPTATLARYPTRLTHLDEVVRRLYPTPSSETTGETTSAFLPHNPNPV